MAALGDTMLKLAGRVADGTVTWMTGTRTIASHISPVIRAAAEKAGRPAPRIGVALPVSVTADIEAARERVNEEFAIYPNLPSYKAMLDKEGAGSPADVAFLGDEDAVTASIERLAAAGATDFVASVVGTSEERDRTFALLSSHRPLGLGVPGLSARVQRSRVVYLNSLRSGCSSISRTTPSMVRRASAASPWGRLIRRTNTARSVDDEGRHPEDAPLGRPPPGGPA